MVTDMSKALHTKGIELTETTPGLFDFGVKREVVATTHLRAYPGWVIRKWRDEYARFTYDASHAEALSPLEGSFADALFFAKSGGTEVAA